MTPEPCPIFDEFVLDHPEYADSQRAARMADGSAEWCVPVDVIEAFARWCLMNGHGDAQKLVAFLAETIPQLKAQQRDLSNSTPPRASGGESAGG